MQVKLFQGQTHSRLKPQMLYYFLQYYYFSIYHNIIIVSQGGYHLPRLPKDTFISTQESQREKVL